MYVQIPAEEVKEAASVGDLSASGPIFGIYAALAIMFKIGSMLVELATPKSKISKGKDDPNEPKVKVGLMRNAKKFICGMIAIKPKKEGE